jgi:hypothetical protein
VSNLINNLCKARGTDFATYLRSWGLKVVTQPGWDTRRSREQAHQLGVMLHHDACTGSCLNSITNHGSANAWVDRDGTVYLIMTGRAYHAGLGVQSQLRRIERGEAPLVKAPGVGNYVGNGDFFGVEIRQPAVPYTPYPTVQVLAVMTLSAATIELFADRWAGLGGFAVTTHDEWTTRKWDPVYPMGPYENAPDIRDGVDRILGGEKPEDPAAERAKAWAAAQARHRPEVERWRPLVSFWRTLTFGKLADSSPAVTRRLSPARTHCRSIRSSGSWPISIGMGCRRSFVRTVWSHRG